MPDWCLTVLDSKTVERLTPWLLKRDQVRGALEYRPGLSDDETARWVGVRPAMVARFRRKAARRETAASEGDTASASDATAQPKHADALGQDASFDPALDLPLGVEPVGVRPREIVRLETDPPNDVLPRGAVVRAAVSAAVRAAKEEGYPIGIWSFWIPGGLPGRGRGAARFWEWESVPPEPTPPSVVVDLSAGYSRLEVRESMVDAFMRASRSRRHPIELFPGWPDAERYKRWPELRGQPRRTDNLRERLRAAAEAADIDGGHIRDWFLSVGAALVREAFESAIPVSVHGRATLDSGFQVKWYPCGTDGGRCPSLNLSEGAYDLQTTIAHVVDLVVFAHALDPDSNEATALSNAMRAAAVARLTPQPVAVPFLDT